MVLGLSDYEFQLNTSGVRLNSGSTAPFVDITRVSGLDNAPYRETIRDHEGTDGGFIDAEFEHGRDLVLDGTIYCDVSNVEPYIDLLKSNFAPVTTPIPFYFKSTGVSERLIYVKPRGVRFDWEQVRRTGITNAQFLMYAEDPRIYDSDLLSSTITFGGAATTGFGFTNIYDSFSRSVSSGFGSADTGEAYTNTGGSAGDFSVSGTQGVHAIPDVNVPRHSRLGTGFTDVRARVLISLNQTTTGASSRGAILYRYQDDSNHLFTDLRFTTGGAVELVIAQIVAGVSTSLSNVNIGSYTPGQRWFLEVDVSGATVQAMGWAEGSTRPVAYQAEVGSMPISSSGPVGLRSIRSTGNTNTGLTVSFDNFYLFRGFGFNLSFGTTVPPDGAYIVNNGNRPAPGILTITGPVVDPRIINDTDSKTLAFSITLGASDTLAIDLANHTVTFNGTINRRDALLSANWFLFNPGSTFIRFGGSSGSGYLTVAYRNAWR